MKMTSSEIPELDWNVIFDGIENTSLSFIKMSGLIIYPNGKYRTFTLLFLIGMIILLSFMVFTLSITVFISLDDFPVFVETAHAFSLCTVVLQTLIIHHLRISSYLQLLMSFSTNIFNYESEFARQKTVEMRAQVKKHVKYFQNTLLFCCLGAGFLFLGSPLVQTIYMTKERKEIPSLNYNYPIPLWFPFDTSNVWSFRFAFGYCLIICSIYSIIILIMGYVSSTVLFFMEMYAQLRILNYSIINLDKRAAVLFNSSNNIFENSSSRMAMDTSALVANKDYQRCLLYCLKKNVQHHWAIKRFRDTFQHFSGVFLGVVLVGSGLMIVTLSLTLTKSDSSMSPDNIKLIFILSCELLHLFGYCFCGTLVKDKSLSVQTALFHSSWLQLSQSSKKSLQIFQICSTRPLVLKGFETFEINLECYLQVLNTTYSMFNVLNSVSTVR